MFSFNPKTKEVKEIPTLNPTVSCEDCKHLIRLEDAQRIMYDEWLEMYYCPEHRKQYDELYDGKFYKKIPAHEIEVDKNGKEIKKKK